VKTLLNTLLLASLIALTPARAAEPEAQLGWGLEFGGSSPSVQPVYRLGLAVDGFALVQRTYRLTATDGDGATEVEGTGESGSSGGWVPWVVGGVVAIVAIGTEFADDARRDHACIGCSDDGGGTDVTGADVDDDGNTVGCVGDECVVCPNGDVASTCDGLVSRALRGDLEIDVERQRWLDAGTGHMGDLLQR
jgi:hypothetical protein